MLVWVVCCVASVWAQTDRAVITHNSESITIAPIVYGIEKGFYRNEGINLEFRFLRSDLAAAAISGGQEIRLHDQCRNGVSGGGARSAPQDRGLQFQATTFLSVGAAGNHFDQGIEGKENRSQLSSGYRWAGGEGRDSDSGARSRTGCDLYLHWSSIGAFCGDGSRFGGSSDHACTRGILG